MYFSGKIRLDGHLLHDVSGIDADQGGTKEAKPYYKLMIVLYLNALTSHTLQRTFPDSNHVTGFDMTVHELDFILTVERIDNQHEIVHLPLRYNGRLTATTAPVHEKSADAVGFLEKSFPCCFVTTDKDDARYQDLINNLYAVAPFALYPLDGNITTDALLFKAFRKLTLLTGMHGGNKPMEFRHLSRTLYILF